MNLKNGSLDGKIELYFELILKILYEVIKLFVKIKIVIYFPFEGIFVDRNILLLSSLLERNKIALIVNLVFDKIPPLVILIRRKKFSAN